MNEKIKHMNQFFDNQIQLCKQQEKDLQEDDRRDEANFQKIKANVYDIFKTILAVAQKVSNGDPQRVKQFFWLKTEQIPANWEAAYEAAKLHDDIENMVVEKIKLNTIQEIRDEFLNCWEEIK